MISSQATAPTMPKTLNVTKQPFVQPAPIAGMAGLENKIRERAYQLYEDRGREPGRDTEDWAQAEREIAHQRS
jgi:hypothetical protein